jgi:hypothetical protein
MTQLRLPHLLAVLVATLVVTVAIAGCAEERPDPEVWQTTWDAVRDRLPPLEMMTGEPDQAVCSATLAMLREETPTLSPTPDLAIDDVVRDWIEIAEDAFFECPPRGEEIDSFEKAYGELERLEAEVAVVLEIDTAE